MGTYNNKPEYKRLFSLALNDSSYSVAGAALEAISIIDNTVLMDEVKKLKNKPAKGKLAETINRFLIENGAEEDFDIIAGNFDKLPVNDAKFEALRTFAQYLSKFNNSEKFKKGIDMIISFRDAIPASYQNQTTPFFNNIVLQGILTQKTAALKGNNAEAIQQQIDYVKGKIEGKKRL